MKNPSELRAKIKKMSPGKIFSIKDLSADTFSYENVRQVLSRMTNSNEIKRVSRGLYVRPKKMEIVGEVLPGVGEIIKEIARTHHETISINGTEALRLLRLSTQMQMQQVYYTSGRSRTIEVRGKAVELQHISDKKIANADTPKGVALLALYHLGHKNVTLQTLDKIKQAIPEDDFKSLLHNYAVMPAWMIKLCKQYERLAK